MAGESNRSWLKRLFNLFLFAGVIFSRDRVGFVQADEIRDGALLEVQDPGSEQAIPRAGGFSRVLHGLDDGDSAIITNGSSLVDGDGIGVNIGDNGNGVVDIDDVIIGDGNTVVDGGTGSEPLAQSDGASKSEKDAFPVKEVAGAIAASIVAIPASWKGWQTYRDYQKQKAFENRSLAHEFAAGVFAWQGTKNRAHSFKKLEKQVEALCQLFNYLAAQNFEVMVGGEPKKMLDCYGVKGADGTEAVPGFKKEFERLCATSLSLCTTGLNGEKVIEGESFYATRLYHQTFPVAGEACIDLCIKTFPTEKCDVAVQRGIVSAPGAFGHELGEEGVESREGRKGEVELVVREPVPEKIVKPGSSLVGVLINQGITTPPPPPPPLGSELSSYTAHSP